MKSVLSRAALALMCVGLALAAWRLAPILAIGDYAGEFTLLESCAAVFAVLAVVGWVEDRGL